MNEINKAIKKAIESLGWGGAQFGVDHPREAAHGDYSTNVALILAKQVGKKPREVAELIVTELGKSNEISCIEKMEVAGAGFINFYLKSEWITNKVQEIVTNNGEKKFKGKKISVEYTDPNPFKEFHLGHLYSNLIGEAMARLYEEAGATVWRADFYGDVGMHIAKSVWGMTQKMQSEGATLERLELLPIKERQNFMGQGYAMGVIKYDEDESIKEEIKQINYMVYVASQEVLVREKGWKPLVNYQQYIKGQERKYEEVKAVYQAGLKWSLAYFETYYERLGTKFNGYYPESWVGELGLLEVEKGLKNGILTYGEEGAVVFPGEQYGLHTRVFRNKLGLPTYEAKDLGLVVAKYSQFKFDYSLNVFGKEIDEYYKVVKKAMELINPELGKKQEHLAHGMVNLPTGKMSSRFGNIITVEWLLNEARDQAKKLIKNEKMGEEEKMEVAEQVGQAAIKYALLKSSVGDNVTFDFATSVTFEGASGPYLQYTYARAKSVLNKASSKDERKGDKLGEQEMTVARELYKYDEVIAAAAAGRSPSTLATYLYQLAQSFNSFYNGNKIGDDPSRLWLTEAVATVMKRGLNVLGISAPEEM